MNLSPLDLLILSLACWRLAYLFTKESGPFDFIAGLRARYPLGGLMNCLYCASVWTAAGVYLLWLTPLSPLVYVLAISGLALLAYRYTGGDLQS
jgi:hypothetical protein